MSKCFLPQPASSSIKIPYAPLFGKISLNLMILVRNSLLDVCNAMNFGVQKKTFPQKQNKESYISRGLSPRIVPGFRKRGKFPQCWICPSSRQISGIPRLHPPLSIDVIKHGVGDLGIYDTWANNVVFKMNSGLCKIDFGMAPRNHTLPLTSAVKY